MTACQSPTMTSIHNESHVDILARLDAMRVQEQTTRCHNYFRSHPTKQLGVDVECRRSMSQWVGQVQGTLDLSPETNWIAMNLLDRYLSSGRGNSKAVLGSRCKFQLAAITCFYTAVKVYEPAILGADMLVDICRGTYVESDLFDMERNILHAVGWKIAVHTPLEFVRHLLQLLPLHGCIVQSLLDACQRHLDDAVADIDFSCLSPSVVGMGCLAAALAASEILTLSEKQAVWVGMSESFAFVRESEKTIVAVQERLLSPSSTSPSSATPPTTSSRYVRSVSPDSVRSEIEVRATKPSPICVVQAAPQA